MERRTLLTRIMGAAGAAVALRASALFGEKNQKSLSINGTANAPCVLPKGGPRAGYFPNVVLINQDYSKGRFYDDLVMGKTVIFNTFSTKQPSPMQDHIMANLVDVQNSLGDRLGRDVFILSISYDPDHDTPQVLHEYAQRLGVRPGWSLLTGKAEDVSLVLARLGLGTMKMGHQVMAPHFGILRIGNEALDRWTTMPAVYGHHMVAQHLSLVAIQPEHKIPKDLKGFVRGGPFPKDIAGLMPGGSVG